MYDISDSQHNQNSNCIKEFESKEQLLINSSSLDVRNKKKVEEKEVIGDFEEVVFKT